jgi:uncharacterized protein (TIGR02118 family)
MTIKLVVLYPPAPDQALFDKHYSEVHMPLADKLPGLLRQEISVVSTAMDGGDLPFHQMTELYFADEDALQAAFGSPEGQAAAADFQQIAPAGARMLVAGIN